MTNVELNFCLTRFVQEVKKRDGSDYPRNTLYEIVMSIHKHFCEQTRNVSFLNDPIFKDLQRSLDCVMKLRAQKGIGVHRRQAQIISYTEENILWENSF